MTPLDPPVNPHETSARREKVDKLVNASLLMVARVYEDDGPSVFETLRQPSYVLWWAKTAEMAGVKAPSETTIGLTVTRLEELIGALHSDPFDIPKLAPSSRTWGQ